MFDCLCRAFVCGRTQDLEETVVSRMKEEVEELEKDLKLQTQMNGITLNSCITKTLPSRKEENLLDISNTRHLAAFPLTIKLHKLILTWLNDEFIFSNCLHLSLQ